VIAPSLEQASFHSDRELGPARGGYGQWDGEEPVDEAVVGSSALGSRVAAKCGQLELVLNRGWMSIRPGAVVAPDRHGSDCHQVRTEAPDATSGLLPHRYSPPRFTIRGNKSIRSTVEGIRHSGTALPERAARRRLAGALTADVLRPKLRVLPHEAGQKVGAAGVVDDLD
jgi:hypothetical protein